MFKRAKKKREEQEEEAAVVDHIIRTYAEEGESEQKLLVHIAEHVGKQLEKEELLESLDRYNALLYENPIFDSFKKRLFGTAKDQYILTHLELSLCFLITTGKYYPEVIADILWIDRARLRDAVQSLEGKLSKGRYRLPKSYKVMQPLVYEYCGL